MVKYRYFYFDHGKYGMAEDRLAAPRENEILVRTTKTLVSVGTETHCNSGNIEWKKGQHGYSNVGVVEKVGPGVEEFRPGDRIFSFKPHVDYYLGNLTQPWFVPYKLPEGLSDADATFCTLAAVALHAVERADIAVGQPVVVVGQGTVGQLIAQLARIGGAGTVIGVDLDEKKLELSKKLGADAGLVPDKGALEEALGGDGKRGIIKNSAPPILIEACGEVTAIPWMMDAARLGSKIVLTGSFMSQVSIRPELIINKELELIGSHQPKDSEQPYRYYPYNRPFNITFVMDLIKRGTLKVKELVSGVITPDQLLGFYDAVRSGKRRMAQPLIDWEG
jgi:2-desacetyl-2-hydroxyethyl bacteriochlorophyllide A dehydrogenase